MPVSITEVLEQPKGGTCDDPPGAFRFGRGRRRSGGNGGRPREDGKRERPKGMGLFLGGVLTQT